MYFDRLRWHKCKTWMRMLNEMKRAMIAFGTGKISEPNIDGVKWFTKTAHNSRIAATEKKNQMQIFKRLSICIHNTNTMRQRRKKNEQWEAKLLDLKM